MPRTDVVDVQDDVLRHVAPPGPAALALRLLLAVGLIVVMVQLATQPVRSNVDALQIGSRQPARSRGWRSRGRAQPRSSREASR